MTTSIDPKMSTVQRSIAGASVALLLTGCIFVFNPWTIYQSNIHEFGHALSTLLIEYLPWILVTLLAVGLCFSVSSVYGRTRWIAACITTGTLVIWIQANLLTFSYGKLDGSALDFDANAWRSLYEIPLWLIALCMAVWRPNLIIRNTTFVSLLLVGLQLALTLTTSSTGQNINRSSSDIPAHYYNYSTRENILHLVLDEFGGKLMEEVLAKRPDLADRFEGFTFYRDATGLFPTTNVSMHAIFTGNVYDYSEPLASFIKKDLPENGIPTIVAEKGYETNLIAKTYLCQRMGRECRIVPGVSAKDETFNQSIHLLDLSLFRAFPHIIKKYIYQDGNWLLLSRFGRGDQRFQTLSYQAIAFLERAIDTSFVAQDLQPQYNMYHVALPHLPAVSDANCNFIGKQPFEKASFLTQAECATVLTTRLLNRLKELGVYDNTEIIIHSDHGSWFDVTKVPVSSNTAPIAWDMSRASALLMHKPRQGSGKLIISDAPASLADIRPTLLASIGLETDGNNLGLNLSVLSETQKRDRSYWAFSWKGVLAERDYLPEAKHFIISGDHYQQSNWTYAGTESGQCIYQVGDVVNLVADAPPPPFCISIGLSNSEQYHTWTNGERVYVQFNLSAEGLHQPLVMNLQLAPFAPDSEPLHFSIGTGGTTLGKFELSSKDLRDISLDIPPALVVENMDFEINIDNPRRPIDLGLNNDKRALGLRLTKWSLTKP